jgi:hypothetical protein
MGTGAFAPAQSQIARLCLNLRFHRKCVGCYRAAFPWLVFARWLVSYGFPALLFSCDTHLFAYRGCFVTPPHVVVAFFPRRLAAFLFLVVTITITTIIIVINIIITGPKNRLPTRKRSTARP